MKHTYYESFNKEDVENIYIKCNPDIYKIYTRCDLSTLSAVYCIDMWFVETNLEKENLNAYI